MPRKKVGIKQRQPVLVQRVHTKLASSIWIDGTGYIPEQLRRILDFYNFLKEQVRDHDVYTVYYGDINTVEDGWDPKNEKEIPLWASGEKKVKARVVLSREEV